MAEENREKGKEEQEGKQEEKAKEQKNEVKVSYHHKDRFFFRLFGKEGSRKNILELYNALHGTHYTDEDSITINIIGTSLFISRHNDVSFLITETMLSLWEEQSSFNPNMPVRGLFSLAQLYSQYITVNKYNVFGEELVELPAPTYVVFYIGTAEKPDRMELKLSDAFPDNKLLDFTPCAEVTAVMLNINLGHNKELLSTCRALRGYSTVIWHIRKNVKDGQNLNEAVLNAVNYCIEHDILAEELAEEKAEVLDMLVTEMSEEEIRELFRAEGERKGMAEGERKGRAEEKKEAGRYRKLTGILAQTGRNADLVKASGDEAYCRELYKELGI